MPISARVKETIKAPHGVAMSLPLMQAFMHGGVQTGSYYDYIGQLIKVYEVLESCDWLPLYDERLNRLKNMNSDISGKREHIVIRQETRGYVEYLENLVEEKDQVKLMAHYYVRYIGDLAAQLMAGLISKNLNIPMDGLIFYKFDNIGDQNELKANYWNGLDQIIDEEDAEVFLKEILVSFKYIEEIVLSLGRRWL